MEDDFTKKLGIQSLGRFMLMGWGFFVTEKICNNIPANLVDNSVKYSFA
jgi:hypothetical protein